MQCFGQECARFKALILTAFNRQFNTSFTASDVKFWPQRPLGNEVARMMITTNVAGDEVRILVQVQPWTFFNDVTRFVMKLLPNYGAGDGRDEVQVANVSLNSNDYKELRAYFSSSSYRSRASRPIGVVSASGQRMMTMSGFPVQQQSF